MATPAGFTESVKTLNRSALLAVPAPAAYAVIVDVLAYPDFVPGCEQVEVLRTTPTGLIAQVAVAGRGLHESFVTENIHQPFESVVMSLREGPFEVLEGRWQLTPLGDTGCRIDLHIEFIPKGVLARVLSGFIDRIANRVVDSFSDRIVSEHQLIVQQQEGQ
jgi:ribosome-associated toxin RatA of RatAB toxin-antitoxin module